MKVDMEYTELLDIVSALLARAAHFERLPAEGAGPEPDHWQREATGRSLISCSPRPTTPTIRMMPTLR